MAKTPSDKPVEFNDKTLTRCTRCGWLKWDHEMHKTPKGRTSRICEDCSSYRYKDCPDAFRENKSTTPYSSLKRIDPSIARAENCIRQAARVNANPTYKLSNRISRAIGTSLRGNKAGMHWEDIVGYTVHDLKDRLQSQFENGMTWGNYGQVWQIDHIVPIKYFTFSSYKDIEFRKCWSLANLQPLFSIDNRRKGGRMSEPYQFIKKIEIDMLFSGTL